MISGGILGTGLALKASSYNRIIGANDRINIGVIGTGDRGGGIIRLLKDIEQMNVMACSDLIPFRLDKAISNSSPEAKAYANYQQLLDNQDVDAVILSTPFKLHGKMAIDIVDTGKHIYCEKTMIHDYKLTKKLKKKLNGSSLTFQAGHQFHNSRLYRRVVEMIEQGWIGEVAEFKCQWNRNGDWRRPVPDPTLEKLINWRMYREFSGGLLAELSSHQIDFCNWVMKDHPARVSGFGSINYWKDGRETYDNIKVTYEYPNGVKASFTSLTTNKFDGYRIWVKGKKGTIALGQRNATIYTESKDEKKLGLVDGVSGASIQAWSMGKGVPIEQPHEEPTKQALLDFRHNIQESKTPESNVHTGGMAATAVELGLKAMIKGKVINWKEKYS